MKGAIPSLNKEYYQAFGLTIASDISLPELNRVPEQRHFPDIYIQKCKLSQDMRTKIKKDDVFFIDEQSVIFHVPGVAVYIITGGVDIKVYPFLRALEDEIRLYLLGTCMGVILLQRKLLPLHGSAIEIDGKVYAVIGDSGTGKSTLAHAFLERGFTLVSDDVIPISYNQQKVPYAIPSYPQQKLWVESLHFFGKDHTKFRPLINRERKFSVPINGKFRNTPLPLAAIIELIKTEETDVSFTRITQLERLFTLYKNTYRHLLLEPLHLVPWHFEITCKIAEQIPMYRIMRPKKCNTVNKIVEIVLTKMTEKEHVI